METKTKKEFEEIANSIVKCPYCRELFRVTAGWFFIDNPNITERSGSIQDVYIPKKFREIFKERGFKIDKRGYVEK